MRAESIMIASDDRRDRGSGPERAAQAGESRAGRALKSGEKLLHISLSDKLISLGK